MMVVETTFRHMEANTDIENVISNHVRSMRRHDLGFTRIAITVDALNKNNIRCHVMLRGKNKLSADTQVTDKDVISAIAMAFDSLEREVQHKLGRKQHRKSRMSYAFIDEYMSDFEDMYDILPQRRSVPSSGYQHRQE